MPSRNARAFHSPQLANIWWSSFVRYLFGTQPTFFSVLATHGRSRARLDVRISTILLYGNGRRICLLPSLGEDHNAMGRQESLKTQIIGADVKRTKSTRTWFICRKKRSLVRRQHADSCKTFNHSDDSEQIQVLFGWDECYSHIGRVFFWKILRII